MYDKIPKYIPVVCPNSRREGNHYICTLTKCPNIEHEEQYICPCLGVDSRGEWIRVTNELIQEKIREVNRWNKCREKIPCKDKWSLEGIKHFRVFPLRFEMVLTDFDVNCVDEVKKELIMLLNNGDKVGFNAEWGVGDILMNSDNTFTVVKWHYRTMSMPVNHGTLEDVMEFLASFWSNHEHLDYNRCL